MTPCSYLTRNLKYTLMGLIGCLLVLLSPMAAGWAQDLDGSLGWKSYGIEGDVAYASVRLDGYRLFSIATERTKEGGQWGLGTLQIRRNRIENRLKSQLYSLISRNIQPTSLQVTTTRLNQQMAVQAVIEGKAAKPLVTVTSLDAEIYGLSEAEVAEEYARQIQQALLRALQERQPAAQREHIIWAGLGGTIAVLLMALLFGWQRQIGRIRWQLRQEFHQQHGSQVLVQAPSQEGTEPPHPLFELKRKIERKTWQKHLLQILCLVVGVLGLAWVLQCFPQTRSLGVITFRQPIGMLLIGLMTSLSIACSRFAIDWILTRWIGTEDKLPQAQIERRRQRVPTLSAVCHDITAALLILLGVMLAYSLLSFSTGLTLISEIGVLGVAVSLAFQSSIKDALSGWMLMVRDAYTVGDMVTVKEITGDVEEMGLFMTQIRTSAGNLMTIRNGEIASVTNLSKDWTRMDFSVLVDYATDAAQAMTLMREVFQSMQTDAVWGAMLIGKPDILGVEQFERDGILLRLRTRTQGGEQFNVAREFRFRLNHGFRKAGIRIAIHQREVQYRASGSTHPQIESLNDESLNDG